MAFVFTRLPGRPDVGRTVTEITLDGTSYASGGIPLTPSLIGMLTTPVIVDAEFSTGEGFSNAWIASTNALKLYKTSTGTTSTECVAADFTTAMKIRVTATGIPVV